MMRPSIDDDGRLRRQIGAAVDGVARSIAEALEADRDRDFARHIRLAREAATAVRDGLQSALIKRYVSEGDLRAVRVTLGQLYPALTSLLLSTEGFRSQAVGRGVNTD
jgi:four helix bundle protein